MPERDLEHELEQLRRSYRVKLPAKLARLDALLAEARESSDPKNLRAARDLAHTLKGTSGSYGLDEFSAELQIVETCLDRLRKDEDESEIWVEMERALARARKECFQGDSGGTSGPP